MPAESQLLYFHLVLRADDDGVVESYPVMKLLGIASDNFKILLAKSFIKQISEEEVIVIVDWFEHNKIRPDRKIDSIYNEILIQRFPEIKLIESKKRADTGKKTHGRPLDVHSRLKLSKDKLSKDKLSIENTKKYLFTFNEIYKTSYKSTREVEPLLRESLKVHSLEEIQKAVKIAAGSDEEFYNTMTPVRLLRTRNKNGLCDYVEDLLNMTLPELKPNLPAGFRLAK